MAPKLSAGDTIGMSGEVPIVHDDGNVTLRLNGYDFPVTTRPEFLTLIAKRSLLPGGGSVSGIGRTNSPR